MQKFLYENKFDLYEYEPVGKTHFHKKIRFDTEAKGNSEMAQLNYCQSDACSLPQ